jgi:AraC-like DNA-binding protein
MLNLNIAILSFGIFQSGLLGIAVLRRKPQHPANVYLVLFLLVVALQLTFKLISKAWLWEHTRTIYMFSYYYGYLIGPLIYLFFRSQREEKIFKTSDWLHFVPFAIQVVLTILDEVFGVMYQIPLSRLFPWPSLQIISMICYGVAAWKFTTDDKHNMRQFIIAVFAVESVIMCTILFLVQNIDSAPDLRIVFALLTTLIFWMTYKLIVSPEEFYVPRDVPVIKLVASATTRYANSGLRHEESNTILSSLKLAIEKEQVFLQPDITIDDVAKKLSVKKHHLSQVINQEFGHSFTELVYKWRLDEAARRLCDPQYHDHKLSAIAFDLGFSSVSVFTTTFKKRFGVTPSAYKSSVSTVGIPHPSGRAS